MDGRQIEVVDVSKTFGKQEVLRHVSLSMKSGNIYGLIGRNGSGKTVLMKCICGLLRPTSGQILMDGRYLEEEERLLEDFGIIIGNPGFLPHYSGRKNLRMLAMIRGKCGKDGNEAKAGNCAGNHGGEQHPDIRRTYEWAG